MQQYAVVAVYRGEKRIGTGFLYRHEEEVYAITCAHVVNSALNIDELSIVKPDNPVVTMMSDFYSGLENKKLEAVIEVWGHEGQDRYSAINDLAILKVQNISGGDFNEVVDLVDFADFTDIPFELWGYPNSNGDMTSGLMGVPNAAGLISVQVGPERSTRIKPGFSGGPVVTAYENAIAGIMCLSQIEEDMRVGQFIPVKKIKEKWNLLVIRRKYKLNRLQSRYKCNRKLQLSEMEKKDAGSVYIFFVSGHKDHSHEGFMKRLYFEFNENRSSSRNPLPLEITLSDTQDTGRTEREIYEKFYEDFLRLDYDDSYKDSAAFTAVVTEALPEGVKTLFIHVQLPLAYHKPFYTKVIIDFIHMLESLRASVKGFPIVYLIISIVEESTANPDPGQLDTIWKEYEAIPFKDYTKIIRLPPLKLVKRRDIEDWVDMHSINDPAGTDALKMDILDRNELKGKNDFFMLYVEPVLENIVIDILNKSNR